MLDPSAFTGRACVGATCFGATELRNQLLAKRQPSHIPWHGLLEAYRPADRALPRCAHASCALNYSAPEACPAKAKAKAKLVEPCVVPPRGPRGTCAGGNGEEQTALHFLRVAVGSGRAGSGSGPLPEGLFRDGVFLEIGANDGRNSNTRNLEHCLGWRGLLIEGQPTNFERLRKNRPSMLAIGSAICPSGRRAACAARCSAGEGA